MLKFILRLGLFQRLPYFKRAENATYIVPYADLTAFFIQALLIATTFSFLENGVAAMLEKNFSELCAEIANSVYFVMTTATTVGYGDISPTTLISKFFVVAFIFLYLSARLIKILAIFAEAKTKVDEFKRIGRYFETMNDHIIVYCDAETIKRDGFLWLKRFVKENETSRKFKDNHILLVNHNEDASQMLNDAMLSNHNFDNRVTHMNLNIDEDDFFEKISIENARHVYVLGNSDDTHSDSKVFDFAYRVEEETKYEKDVTAEIVNDKNRKRMYEVGVDVIMRPNRAYPEMLVTVTIAPDTAPVLEEMSSRGDDTLEVFSIPESASTFTWSDILLKLSVESIGTAIGVVYPSHVDINPMGKDQINGAIRIVMMIHEMRQKNYEDVQAQINKAFDEI